MIIQQHLDFKDLFPGEQPLGISQYLMEINRDDLIRIALLFIHIKDYNEANSYAVTFASGDNPNFAQYMLNQLSVLVGNNPNKSFNIGSSITGLKLMQYVFATPPIDKTSISNAQIIENITKAISLIN